jgi:hypothetical protein
MNIKNKFYLLIICAAIFLSGFLVSFFFTRESIVKISEIEEKLASCETTLEEIYPPLPEEIYSLGGVVMERHDDFIIIQSRVQVSRFPLPDKDNFEIHDIKVSLNDKTKIFTHKLKEINLKELSDETIKGYEVTPLAFDEIKVNQLVNISSEENIKGKQEFIASEIFIVEEM